MTRYNHGIVVNAKTESLAKSLTEVQCQAIETRDYLLAISSGLSFDQYMALIDPNYRFN